MLLFEEIACNAGSKKTTFKIRFDGKILLA
jgi:hypothetical protein